MSDFDKQLSALRAALAVSPENVLLRLHLADTLREAGLFDQAVEEFQAVLKQDANSAPAHAALGKLAYEAKNLEVALEHLQCAIKLNPYDAPTLFILAQVESELGQLAESLIHQGVARALDSAQAKKTEPAALSANGEVTSSISEEENEAGSIERPAITFAEVGGLEAVKEQIRLKIIYPFQRPELYKAYGKKAGGGILLYGPPGCGKTLLARATAGEVHAHFIHVGITDVLNMYLGETERKLHAIFELARRKIPSVLFFDEVDALGGKRNNIRENWLRAQVDQFLAEMDGMMGNNEQLLIIAATNTPWNVDNALMRPGRFDRVVFVPPPDYAARLAILQVLVQGKPVTNLDYPRLAHQTEGYSGADLMGMFETAIDKALQETMRTGKVRPLTTENLLQALRDARLSMEEWLNTARDYAIYGNESGFYDEVLEYLKKRKRVQ